MTALIIEIVKGSPVADCLKAPRCRGRVIIDTDALGYCDGCGEEYEVAFKTVLKVAK